MARGIGYDNSTIYRILASYTRHGTYRGAGRELNLPHTTVRDVVKRNIDKPMFAQIITQSTNDFIEDATRIINIANRRLENQLLDEGEKIAVNQLSTVIGTMYDKRALANGQATENAQIHVVIDKAIQELGV